MKTIFSFFAILLSVSFISNVSRADIRLFELHRKKLIAEQYEAAIKAKSLESKDQLFGNEPKGAQEFTYDQKLDHNDPSDTRTFKQRYFINSDYADGLNSPVLYFICGEGICNPNRSILEQANKLRAHVVYAEHRYYGKSLPMTNLTTENLKYLSTEMALKDLRALQLYLQNEKHFSGKWISVGGSYAGSLSAYYRLMNSDIVAGALASSGPVKAKENFEEYDLHVSEVVGKSCGSKMREVVKQVEAALNNPTELAAIKRKFQGQSLVDDVDFLYLVADMGAFAVQYGSKDRFCELVDSSTPLEGYAQFTRETFMMYGMNALDMSAAGAVDTQVTEDSSGMRQWFYQSCTEYGYWQNAYHDKKVSVRSAMINPAYHKNICKRLFGLDISGNEDYMNKKFYEPLLDSSLASNILFTNGSEDPWSKLSIAVENKNDTNKATEVMTLNGGSHCSDLSLSGDPEIMAGRERFIELSKEWIK